MAKWKDREYATWADAAEAQRAESAPVAVLDLPPAEPDPVRAPDPAPLTLTGNADPPAKRLSLVAKHRPRTLADVVGQPEAVATLRALVADPYPCGIILAGATGTGKTSAAYALAADLGCDLGANPPEFGGVWSIPAGDQSADALREIWPKMWRIPFQSVNGWKVLIVNEVEQLNGTVERLWLDRLEEMPPRTVIVFTTNAPETLPARFVDRCTLIEFESAADKLQAAARALAAGIWREETGDEIPADVLQKVMDRSNVLGGMSFRRTVQALIPLLAGKVTA